MTAPQAALLIDLDGTVLDSMPLMRTILANVCDHFHCPFDRARFQRYCGYTLSSFLSCYFQKEITQGTAALPDILSCWSDAFRRQDIPRIPFIPHVLQALSRLRAQNIVCVLVTNRIAEHLRDYDDIVERFDAIQTWQPTSAENPMTPVAGEHSHSADSEDTVSVTARQQDRCSPIRLVTNFHKPDWRALWPAIDWLFAEHALELRNILFVGDSFADLEACAENEIRFLGVLTGAIQQPKLWQKRMQELRVPPHEQRILSSLANLTPEHVFAFAK